MAEVMPKKNRTSRNTGTGDKYDKMYKALDRMMSFLYKCVKETPAGKNLAYNKETHTFDGVDYEDDGNKFPTAKWVSPTFKAEAGKYFNLPNLAAYYLYVQFNLVWTSWRKICWCGHGTA